MVADGGVGCRASDGGCWWWLVMVDCGHLHLMEVDGVG
jgi:hypothetical protein